MEQETKDLLRELDQKRVALRDERSAWSKQNRAAARTDINFAHLEEALREISSDLFVGVVPPGLDEEVTEKEMLILLSDWHIGLTFENEWGRYSTEVAVERLRKFITEIYKLQQMHKCKRAVVLSLGDMISGSIHRTVQLQNRENWVQQVTKSAELIANFLFILSGFFPSLTYSGCSGNHSRIIESKDDAVKDERADLLIDWIISKLLEKQENVEIIKPLDSTMTRVQVCGLEVVGVHGDYDRFNKNGVTGIASMLRIFPDIVCYGHLHSAAFAEENGTVLLRGGSLCGSGDDYTIQRRLTGAPSQTVAIVTTRGIESIYPVKLD